MITYTARVCPIRPPQAHAGAPRRRIHSEASRRNETLQHYPSQFHWADPTGRHLPAAEVRSHADRSQVPTRLRVGGELLRVPP